ncbi:MAG: hydrogenase iron-sulfur subunit, partial [Planctomycetota bacterium]|nr:hydrogenase iron-sulfur subunit [Planctomycetota bacterium]
SHGETLPHRVAFLLAPPPASSKDSTGRALELASLFRRRLNIEVLFFLNSLQVAERELEEKYREGRKSGVLFFPYNQLPAVRVADKEITVSHKDIFTEGSPGSWTCDFLVVDEKAAPGWEVDWPTRMFNAPSDREGFFSSSNPTALPAESGRKGVFVVGNSRANSSTEESLAEASAAAAGVSVLLAKPEIEAETHATVDPQKCALCLTCVRVCPHSAIDYGEYPEHKRSAARIFDAACIGCGICVGECPARAIELTTPAPEEKPAKTLVLCCKRSAQQARETLAAHKWTVPKDVCFVEVPCAGRVDTGLILKAFETGHERVLVLGCHEDACKSIYGNTAAQRRVDYLKKNLPAIGIAADRLEMRRLAASQVERLAAVQPA